MRNEGFYLGSLHRQRSKDYLIRLLLWCLCKHVSLCSGILEKIPFQTWFRFSKPDLMLCKTESGFSLEFGLLGKYVILYAPSSKHALEKEKGKGKRGGKRERDWRWRMRTRVGEGIV